MIALSKYAHFTPAVTLTGAYVVTIENQTAIDVGSVTNDFVTNAGAGEWLGMAFLPPNWLHGYDLFLGANDFDADHMIWPHVTYDITAAYNPNPFTTCSGLTGTFTNASSPILDSRFYNFNAAAGIPDSSFIWNFGDGSPEEYTINATHVYAATGTYNVTLIDSLEGWTVTCIDSVVGTATFLSGTPPVASFTNVPTALTVAFTDASTNSPTTWSWDFGDGNTSTLQNPSHSYAGLGSYTACLTVSDSCGTDTSCQQVLVLDGIEDVLGEGWQVYPVPASESAWLQARDVEAGELHWQLSNMLGQTIKAGQLFHSGGEFKQQLDLEGLGSGVYFVRLQGDHGKIVLKLLKE